MAISAFFYQEFRAEQSEDVAVFFYFNEIPPFVEDELVRLYGHIHSSLAFFKAAGWADKANTYVAWRGGRPVTVLLFQCKDGVIDVLNEMVAIDEAEICRFADHIFNSLRSIWAIKFRAVQADIHRLHFPYQRHNSKEDWVVHLPDGPAEYTARLGKSTRENIKYYRRRLVRDFPSFTCRFYTGKDIDEGHIRGIIELSEKRILAKRKRFGIDESDLERIIRLAKQCGFVCVMQIDGRLCAGTISYRAGSAYLIEVIAHDQKYNKYSLGTICYYMTICEYIVRGAKKFHMGGGRNEYKARFLGVRQDMDHLEIYRSHTYLVLNLHRVAKTAIDGYIRRVKVWLLERENSFITQSVIYALYLLRRLGGRNG
ncbi:MAG TPA: GNAT family N-acetyltransferase [Azospirillum sp.]|nr:GNAT family N-acetyltransferase [Azospirillum sp.]